MKLERLPGLLWGCTGTLVRYGIDLVGTSTTAFAKGRYEANKSLYYSNKAALEALNCELDRYKGRD